MKLSRTETSAAALAVLSVGMADLGWQPVWAVLAWAAGLVLLALAARWAVGRFVGEVSAKAWERSLAGLVVAGVVYRVALSPLSTEWLVLDAMRNALLAMLAVPTVRRVGPVLMGVSLALVLACSVIGQNVGVVVIAVAFAAVGAAWLARDRDGGQARVPWGAVAAVALAAGGVATATHARAALTGLLPAWADSSGGDLAGDDRATSGLGDGPDQQAGPDGDAGFDRSDFFCETDGQCLYDAFVEAYGEPVDPSTEKAQWLGMNEDVVAEHREQDLRNGTEQRPTRRFSLRRERRGVAASADAVLWVEAAGDQYPLRLPVLAFDHYHGGHWHEQPDEAVMTAMDNAGDDGWFVPVDQPVGGVWGVPRRVSVSTGTYDGNVLPLPGGMTRFRMGKVRRADLFASAAEPMLRVNRRGLPAGSVIDVDHRTAVRGTLAGVELAAGRTDDAAHHPAAARLARRWAGDLPRGWAQVEAVVQGLRGHATFDPDAATPADAHGHGCPVEAFLHDTKRGDAHLFASATVLMLQGLGYDARLTGGYYADAADIDPASGRAVVTRRHAHVWPQVRLAAEAGTASSRGEAGGIARGGQWIDLEPTPGFALADGAPTLAQRAGSAWSAALAWAGRRWPVLLGGAALLVGLVLCRRGIADVVDWSLWRLRAGGDGRTRVLRTLALLDRRAARRGRPRPPGRTFASWPETRGLAAAADWALHAPADEPGPAGIAAACRAAAAIRKPRPSPEPVSTSAVLAPALLTRSPEADA